MKKTVIIISTLITSFAASAQTMEDGLKALDFERYEHARNIFSNLTQQEPANGDNYYYLGQAYNNLFKPDSALWAYTKGTQVAPTNPANFAGLGGLLLVENKIPEAKLMFDKALSFGKKKQGMNTDLRALRLVAEAMISTETKLVDEAQNLMQQIYEQDKKDYDGLITAGDVYLEKNDGGLAATNYERAVDVQKTNPKAYTRVAYIWERVRNFEAMQTDLTRALGIDPNYAPALKLQAELYYLQRKFALAKESYMKYLANSEASTANKLRFAQILFRAKEYDEALIQIDDLLKTEKNNVYLYRMMGYSCYEVAAPKNDVETLKKGLASMEEFMRRAEEKKILASDYEYLGKLQAKLGNDSLAMQTLTKALQVDSNKVELLPEIAKINSKMKRFGEAVKNYQTYVVKAKKVSVVDYFLYGKACFFASNFTLADSIFSIVNQKSPTYAEGYYYKGMSHARVDENLTDTISKFCFEKYLDLVSQSTTVSIDKIKGNLINSNLYLGDYCYKYSKKGEEKLCRKYWDKVVELDPANKTALEYLKTVK